MFSRGFLIPNDLSNAKFSHIYLRTCSSSVSLLELEPFYHMTESMKKIMQNPGFSVNSITYALTGFDWLESVYYSTLI